MLVNTFRTEARGKLIKAVIYRWLLVACIQFFFFFSFKKNWCCEAERQQIVDTGFRETQSAFHGCNERGRWLRLIGDRTRRPGRRDREQAVCWAASADFSSSFTTVVGSFAKHHVHNFFTTFLRRRTRNDPLKLRNERRCLPWFIKRIKITYKTWKGS